jgi:hypothetical protein
MAILGGEPLINKDIVDIVYFTREAWNKEYNEYFELVTNGFLLYKYPELPLALKETDCVLYISIHSNDSEYLKKFEDVKKLVDQWVEKYEIKVTYEKQENWSLPYRGIGNKIEPFNDGDYYESWNNCPTGQKCFQLLDGNIYKCSALAYLPMLNNQINLSSKWDPYLEYKPLTPDCSDQDIIDFFNKGAEKFCSMCPSKPRYFEKPNPFKIIKV